MRRFIFAILICFITFSAFAMSKEDYIEDATTIISLFETQYAALRWKEKNLGLNFGEMSEKFIADASNCKSDKAFYEIVAKFLASFEDAHISYQIPSTYSSRLPFNVRYIQGEALISFIDDEEVTKEQFPFKRGDELIAIDGVDVREIVNEIIKYIKNGYDVADNREGYNFITHRPQSRFPYIPTGKSKITIQPREGGSSKTVELEWITTGYNIVEKGSGAVSNMAKMIGMKEFTNRDLSEAAGGSSNRDIKPFFELWNGFEKRSEDPFFTGTFELDGHKIGYLRIDTWYGPDLPKFSKIYDFLSSEIKYLSDNTEALIIDQTGNSGGDLCYVPQVASFFTGIPQSEIRLQVRANSDWRTTYEKWAQKNDDMHSNLLEIWVENIRRTEANGDFITPPMPLCYPTGIIPPNRNENGDIIVYFKPILLLNDEFTVSAGDEFAAMMQDWGVATLFGGRTKGGGASVLDTTFIGHSELWIRLTSSLLYREKEVISPEGHKTHYIENVGVTPDIPYEITIDDFLNGYKGYREAVNSAVLSLIQK